jgi:hypothetical protein
VNRPPQTWIIGAPAETTGGSFKRHLYWFGSDEDGQVVQYIYAITDSTVQDPDDPEGLDEEDNRFNPFVDITTTTESEGFVGWTTKSDSVFTFVVDRGATTAKDITFHIIAVDDRGAFDRTPARLHFFDNSLGNPQLRFEVYIDEGPGGTAPPQWQLRWVGDPKSVDLAATPEASARPFVGFARRFRVVWDASSPNGPIVGYRVKATQGDGPFTPPTTDGVKRWDDTLTEFVYANDQAASTLSASCDSFTAVGCPPEQLRYSSGNYILNVEALDAALVETAPGGGELVFEVNYPPETSLVRGDDGSGTSWPRYELRDSGWNLLSEQSFSEGDTIPAGSYVKFLSTGFDRVPAVAGAEFDSFCCDQVLDLNAAEVRYQTLLEFSGFDGARNIRFANLFSDPDVSDSIGFIAGPFDYSVISRTVDEHRRPDADPDRLAFVAGFPPNVVSVAPSTGDSIIIRSPLTQQTWPENEYPYTVTSGVELFWDGRQYLTDSAPEDSLPKVNGDIFTFRPRFEGAPDPREAVTAVRAWTYSSHSVNDPSNLISDGAAESRDLSAYETTAVDNVWNFSEEEGFQIFVPRIIWFSAGLYDPGSNDENRVQQGAELRQFLGEITMRVGARTSGLGDEYALYRHTRPDPSPDGVILSTIDLERLGRRTEITEVKYHIFLGLDPSSSGSIQRLWPDY